MDRDDVFIGMPFSIKTYYDDFKREIPRIEENINKLTKTHESSKKKFEEMTENLLKLKQTVNDLFVDLSGDKEGINKP
ncbi:MAG: hypothetical protein M1433_02405 [Candidatus Parvarchaeota archaeon]|nr:hypothetical protein [Candidatus Parvarchaeota archaeon]